VVLETEELSVELERAALRQVRVNYTEYNHSLFKNSLRTPSFCWLDSTTELGVWRSTHREIGLARVLLTVHGWGVLVEVLKHEMAHQYVDEVLGAGAEGPHGPLFRRVCDERGIDARSLGLPRAERGDTPEGRILERVAKLLALAESPNAHEAQAAMSAAQRLILKYNIEALLASDAHHYHFRHLGKPSGRVEESQRILSTILAEHFFVEAIWVPVYRPVEKKRGSVLEICGTLHNLELAEYVHAFLTRTAEQLWREHKKLHGIRRNAHRRAFVSGVMMGFSKKLESERGKNQEVGLVWQGDAELHGFFRRRHPHIRWARPAARHDRDSYHAGREAGGKIVLRRGVSQGASGGPKLLPGR